MTLHELWQISPESFVFIEDTHKSETVTEYHGEKYGMRCTVVSVKATSYPMYKSVLQVKIK